MLTPVCPNCRERMSSAEHELGGVWSCIYCEGCWLSSREIQSLARGVVPAGSELVWRSVSTPLNTHKPELFCSACQERNFEVRAINDVYVHQCTKCRGVFFEKGTLAALASHKFRSDQEAPQSVGKIIATTAAVDIGISILLSLFF